VDRHAPGHVLHGLGVRPQPARLLLPHFVGPARLEPADPGNDLAEQPGTDERGAPDP
jgi:hypothetical protein